MMKKCLIKIREDDGEENLVIGPFESDDYKQPDQWASTWLTQDQEKFGWKIVDMMSPEDYIKSELGRREVRWNDCK